MNLDDLKFKMLGEASKGLNRFENESEVSKYIREMALYHHISLIFCERFSVEEVRSAIDRAIKFRNSPKG